MKLLTPRRLAVAAAATVGLSGAAGVALAAGGSTRSSGPDYTYAADDPFADASAVVHVVRTGNGGTHVTLHVRGVDAKPGRIFGAHVHESPCGEQGADAGPHYAHADADPTASLEQREVWLDVAVNAAGHGHANAKRPWPLDESSPRSVIIHALPTDKHGLAGPRLACIDLDGQP